MEKLKILSSELQSKVDEFKYSDKKPDSYWGDLRKLIEVNCQIIRIKYHGQ